MPTEQQVAAVVLGLVNAALPAVAPPGGYAVRAFEPDEVPTTRPAEYVVLTVVRRGGGTPRGGRYTTTGWSFYLMGVSQTSVSNARNSLRLAGDAIESKVLTVAGLASTPVKFDSGRPVAPDDGWLSGVNQYSTAL